MNCCMMKRQIKLLKQTRNGEATGNCNQCTTVRDGLTY